MTRKAPITDLAARLVQLQIAPGELAAIIRRPKSEVEAWVAGDEPDPEGKVLLRILDPGREHAAERAAERVRNKQTLPIKRGADWQTRDIPRDYGGGFSGPDAGRPE